MKTMVLDQPVNRFVLNSLIEFGKKMENVHHYSVLCAIYIVWTTVECFKSVGQVILVYLAVG